MDFDIISLLDTARQWVMTHVAMPLTTRDALYQVAAVLAAFVLGRLITGPFARPLARAETRFPEISFRRRLLANIRRGLPLAGAGALAGIGFVAAKRLGAEWHLLYITANLLFAWVAIRLLATLILDRFWAKTLAVAIWAIAALNIVGLLEPVTRALDVFSITVGEANLTLPVIFKVTVLFLVLFRLGGWLAGRMDGWLAGVQDLTPSSRTLLSKVVRIALVALAVIIPLNTLGIDLTALTVFSGAVGVGLGFGLQKVIANFVSGLILLMDKSVKPGDIIEVGGVWGWITQMSARFTSVITRDGTHYLIPNEDLITNQVINWSYQSNSVRMRIPVGVSYDTDLRLAMRLMEEAAMAHDRTLDNPAPVARIMGFGDSSVDLELRIWIDDPQNGVVNVKSDILLAVWDAFKEHGVEIPFPQRDLHIKSDATRNGNQ